MKNTNCPLMFFCCLLITSCGTSKLRLLEAEKSKTERTLLQTKEQLALSKRTLNKFVDQRATQKLIYQDSIRMLSEALDHKSKVLDSTINVQKNSEQRLNEMEKELNASNSKYKKRIAPFISIQSKIRQQQRTLSNMHSDLKMLLENSPGIKYELNLNKNDITIRLDNSFLFEPKLHYLTESGRWVVFLIGEVLNKKSQLVADIILYPASSDEKVWLDFSNKGKSIRDKLLEKGISDEKISTTNRLISNQSKTDIVISFPISNLLKLLPSR